MPLPWRSCAQFGRPFGTRLWRMIGSDLARRCDPHAGVAADRRLMSSARGCAGLEQPMRLRPGWGIDAHRKDRQRDLGKRQGRSRRRIPAKAGERAGCTAINNQAGRQGRGTLGIDERRGLGDESPEQCHPVPMNMAERHDKLGGEREQRTPQSEFRPEHTHQGASPMPTYPSAGAKPNRDLKAHNPLGPIASCNEQAAVNGRLMSVPRIGPTAGLTCGSGRPAGAGATWLAIRERRGLVARALRLNADTSGYFSAPRAPGAVAAALPWRPRGSSPPSAPSRRRAPRSDARARARRRTRRRAPRA